MFKKIIVPLDGSELAERALAPAAQLARRADGELLLLRVPVLREMVVPNQAGFDLAWTEQSFDQARREAANYLLSTQRGLTNMGRPVHQAVVDGDEAGAIVDTALSEAADLIVMSTHGRSGLNRWVFGSVAEKVLRNAPCPVLIMRYAEPLQNVVITLDGSDLSESALPVGVELARLLDASVTLLRVQEQAVDFNVVESAELEVEVIEAGLGHLPEPDVYERTKSELRRTAERYQPGLKVEIGTAVLAGPAAASILEFAEIDGADLIVMATHGRTGLRRWVYGSVTEKVLRGADCALLVVPPPRTDG